VRAGDTIVGVNGETVATLAAFYRKVWAQGGAGAVVTLELSRSDETRRVEVRSMNRLDHLRLKSSL
jgi:S1-C subfamily serine protease